MVAMSAGYIALMLVVTQVGRTVASRQLDLTSTGPRQLMVAPPFLEFWRRSVTADAGPGYVFGRIDWLPRPRVVLDPGTIPRQLELIDSVPRTVPLQDLLDWARFPYARREGNAILVDDARYARGGRSFAGLVVEDGRGRTRTDEDGRER
jgi:hypothetical protein